MNEGAECQSISPARKLKNIMDYVRYSTKKHTLQYVCTGFLRWIGNILKSYYWCFLSVPGVLSLHPHHFYGGKMCTFWYLEITIFFCKSFFHSVEKFILTNFAFCPCPLCNLMYDSNTHFNVIHTYFVWLSVKAMKFTTTTT